jgi:hypothetical protein
MKMQAGNAVRLRTPWQWGILPAGEIGIVDGIVGKDITDYARIIFHCRGSSFRGHSGGESKYLTQDALVVVSCSGGPCTIGTPVTELTPTNETIEWEFWRWKDFPRAGGGVPYKLTIPIWEWSPNY